MPDSVTHFFESVEAAFAQASQAVPRIERWYSIAGRVFCLRFAGPALLEAMTPALAHLTIDPPQDTSRPAHLTVCIWDSESTATPRLVAPWSRDQLDLRGEVPGYSNDRFLTTAQLDMPAMSILDRANAVGYFWIAHPDAILVFERAAPLKVLLHWWLRTFNVPMIHAAAIGTEDGAVLVTGKTGSGKSTTSLLGLEAGLKFVSDDRCLLELGDIPYAHCIYNSAKLHADHMIHFPHLAAHIENDRFATGSQESDAKSLVYVHRFAPDRLALKLPIRGILLARIAQTEDTTLEAVGRMAVLRELATSTLIYQPGAAQDEVRAMTRLVQTVPCYRINLGSHWAQIPALITETIRQLANSGEVISGWTAAQ